MAQASERRGLFANGNILKLVLLLLCSGGVSGGITWVRPQVTEAEHAVLTERVANIETSLANEINRLHERLDTMEHRWDRFEERVYNALDSH